MGLIRKSLAIGTVGVVRPSSKKQRVAKNTLKAVREGAEASKQAAEASRQIAFTSQAASGHAQMLNQRLDQQASIEHQFRYDTDPAYRQWVDGRAAVAAAHAAEQVAIAAAARTQEAHARAAAIAAKAPPVWHEGDRVIVMQLGFRGKVGEVVKVSRMGCTILLDDGKTLRAVDARKLERLQDG